MSPSINSSSISGSSNNKNSAINFTTTSDMETSTMTLTVASAVEIDSKVKSGAISVEKPATKLISTTTATATIANIMSYQNVIVVATLLLLCGLTTTVDGLKCYMCGQYNEGVGSITPCLNYSDQYAPLYLKECSKRSEKFCVKYVSELSTVRDCATECVEKEIWETQTYCCNHDGCNGSNDIKASLMVLIMPVAYFVITTILNIFKVLR